MRRMVGEEKRITKILLLWMQISIAKHSVDRMPIFFHMLLPTSCASKWYQWLRIWLSGNIRFVRVNVDMSARNRHFQTNYWCITILNWIFMDENIWISTEMSLKFVPMGQINNSQSLVQILAWRRSGDKPLSETMMVNLLTHICVTRLQ